MNETVDKQDVNESALAAGGIPPSDEIGQLVRLVFEKTGQKIGTDDPILAVLIMQQHYFKQDQSVLRNDFLVEMDKRIHLLRQHEQALTDYRNAVLTDITTKAQRETWQITSKIEAQQNKMTYAILGVLVLQALSLVKLLFS